MGIGLSKWLSIAAFKRSSLLPLRWHKAGLPHLFIPYGDEESGKGGYTAQTKKGVTGVVLQRTGWTSRVVLTLRINLPFEEGKLSWLRLAGRPGSQGSAMATKSFS